MKRIIKILPLFFILFNTEAQSAFDNALTEISNDISLKLMQKGKQRVVVLYINDINKTQTVAGKYFADIISNNIVNNSANIKVFDRENLREIMEVKKMISEGYIDVVRAQEIGKLLSVEGIILGNYTVLSNSIKLSVKIIDVIDGFALASSLKDLPINADAGALLGINVMNDGSNLSGTRGFNTPVKSGENYNNPQTVNKDCELKNVGDYCFTNTTNKQLKVEIYTARRGGSGLENVTWSGGEISVDPSQTQCYYNILAIPVSYSAKELNPPQSNRNQINMERRYDYGSNSENLGFKRTGNILIEKCKSKTFIIK